MDIDGQLRFLTYRMLDDSPIVKARMVVAPLTRAIGWR